ncbi:cytidylate kinase [Abditibacteriota bacterium]|nr:cytidylate kinase [Abditibacteriota bacterium]
MKLTVTIARQLGSGGSELGHSLAEALGIRCIDREIISQTAKQFDLQEEELADREERVVSFWERMLSGFVVGAPEAAYVAPPPTQMPSDREIFEAETEVLKKIAAQEGCVIVGRAASHVLTPHPLMLNILLHAPLEFRMARVMQIYGAETPEAARAKIHQSDSMRAKSIAQMTGKNWMAPENYHLCIDTSTLPMPEIAQTLAEFIRRKLASAESS